MHMLDHLNVDKYILNDNELKSVYGGINITGTLFSSFIKAFDLALDLGRSIGTAIRMITSKNICQIK